MSISYEYGLVNGEFANYLKINHFSESSISNYTFLLDKFLELYPNPVNLRYQQIVDYFDHQKVREKSLSYRNSILAMLKKFYDYLFLRKIRNDHPCRRLFLKCPVEQEKIILFDILGKEELQQIQGYTFQDNYAGKRNKIIVSLMIKQGLTPNEIAHIRREHLNFEGETIFIPRSRKLKHRTLLLTEPQIALMQTYLCEYQYISMKGSLLLNRHRKPISPDTIHGLIQNLGLRILDKKVNPTIIRQSVIAQWLNEDLIPLEDVQLMSGHKWIAATNRYKVAPYELKCDYVNQFHPMEIDRSLYTIHK